VTFSVEANIIRAATAFNIVSKTATERVAVLKLNVSQKKSKMKSN
jgi:hypothetical protein